MIPNVKESNNKFYFAKDDMEITIPKGSYKVRDINEFWNARFYGNVRIMRLKALT